MLSAAGAFTVEDLGPGGRSVYRPFHDLLAAHLRGESAVDGTDVDSANGDIGQQRKVRTEQAITHALLATVPTGEGSWRNWLSAHPYIRTYLAQHAAAAEPSTFPLMVSDLNFLAAADPVTLTPLLSPTMTEVAPWPKLAGVPALCCMRTSVPTLLTCRRPLGRSPVPRRPHMRVYAPSIALAWRHCAATIAFSPLRATPVRCGLSRSELPRTDRSCWSPLAMTVRCGCGIRPTGARVGEPFVGHTGPVSSVAFGTDTDERLLLASACDDRTIRLWDPATGRQVGKPLACRHRPGHISGIRGGPEGTTAPGLRRSRPHHTAVGSGYRRTCR